MFKKTIKEFNNLETKHEVTVKVDSATMLQIRSALTKAFLVAGVVAVAVHSINEQVDRKLDSKQSDN